MSSNGPTATPKDTPNPKCLTPSLSKCEECPTFARAALSLPVENKGKFREHYKVGHIVAKSTIGAIRKCLHVSTKQIRLVEFISKRIVPSTAKPKFNYMQELNRIAELEHPNIVSAHEVFQDSRRYYIIME